MKDILVVDDERDSLLIIKELLPKDEMWVQCAASGEEGLKLIENRPFQLMITDLHMPGLNGLELARKAREIAPSMRVIMISGDITPEIPRLAKEAGIFKTLAKPFHPNELLGAVREATGE